MTAMDAKAAVGTFLTAGTAGMGWIELVQPMASLAITVVVGGLTAWYTWERAMKLRKERRDGQDKGKKGNKS